nr:hypothetical protein [Mycobacterium pseudokansasii]
MARMMMRVPVAATAVSFRPRGPTADSTASLPRSAGRSSTGSSSPGTVVTVSAGLLIGSLAGSRTTAFTT